MAGNGDENGMTLEDLKGQLSKHPGLADGLAESIIKWCSPPERQARRQRVANKRINLKNYFASNRNLIGDMIVLRFY